MRNRWSPAGVEMGRSSDRRRTSGSVLSPPVLDAVPAPEIDAVFMTMFKEHQERLCSTALRLTGRRAGAEDLTAETFMRAYRSLSGFDSAIRSRSRMGVPNSTS